MINGQQAQLWVGPADIKQELMDQFLDYGFELDEHDGVDEESGAARRRAVRSVLIIYRYAGSMRVPGNRARRVLANRQVVNTTFWW